MSENTSLRAQSRVNWGRKQVGGIPTDEQLVAGALMRIADAAEGREVVGESRNSAKDDLVWHLVYLGRRYLRIRKRHPLKDQFHFTFEHPTRKTYFSLTIFGLTFSITAK